MITEPSTGAGEEIAASVAHRPLPTAVPVGSVRGVLHHFATPVLAALSLTLWLLGLHPITPSQMASLGLITQLSPMLLLSYPVLLIAVVIELAAHRPRQRLLGAYTAVGVLLVYGLQPASEETARLSAAWLHAGFAQYIAQHGRIFQGYDARFSWPGFFSFVAFITRASDQADATPLLRWAPFILAGLATLAMRALAVAVTGPGTPAWVATWFFLLTEWTEQDYFSPQATTYVLMLGALTLSVRYLVRPGFLQPPQASMRVRLIPHGSPRDRLAAQAAILLIALALAPSHQLTPFVLGSLLLIMQFSGRLWSAWLPWVVLVAAVGWFCLGAKDLWQGHLNLVIGDIGHVGSSVNQGLTERFTGNAGRTFILGVRVGLTSMVCLLAAAGWWWLRRHVTRSWTLPLLAGAPFGLVFLQSYGGEVFVRSYLFALPFASILAGLAVHTLINAAERAGLAGLRYRLARITALSLAAVLLAGLGLATVTARGGNDAYTSFTRADVAAVEYAYQHATPGQTIGALTDDMPISYKRIDEVPQSTFAETCQDLASMASCISDRATDFLIVTPSQENGRQIYSAFPAGWSSWLVSQLVASGKYRLVYQQDGSRVYAKERQRHLTTRPPP